MCNRVPVEPVRSLMFCTSDSHRKQQVADLTSSSREVRTATGRRKSATISNGRTRAGRILSSTLHSKFESPSSSAHCCNGSAKPPIFPIPLPELVLPCLRSYSRAFLRVPGGSERVVRKATRTRQALGSDVIQWTC